MYGTCARFVVKAENRDKIRDIVERQMRAREVAGYVTSYVLMENGSDNQWLFVIFDDRDSYMANADNPAQDSDFQEIRALMETDPEWHDGEIMSM
jgi:antibiotic biosynthesis monooxygenase (ABM) superfamily enzyme